MFQKLVIAVTKIKSLTREDALPAKGIVRVSAELIDGTKEDRSKFFRREPVTIKNLRNGKKVVRYVVGANQDYEDLNVGTIALDYEARDALGVRRTSEPVELEVYRAPFLDRWSAYWNSDDAAMRIANRMAVLAVVIAAIPVRSDLAEFVRYLVALFR